MHTEKEGGGEGSNISPLCHSPISQLTCVHVYNHEDFVNSHPIRLFRKRNSIAFFGKVDLEKRKEGGREEGRSQI